MIEHIEITILGARPPHSEPSLADLLKEETYQLLSALNKIDGNDKISAHKNILINYLKILTTLNKK